MPTVNDDDFKRAMGSFAASVTVLTSRDANDQPVGMTATAFSSVSLDPPLCLVCIDRDASCLRVFRSERVLAVNMLRSDQREISTRFASNVDDRFAGVDHAPGDRTRCPLLEGAMAKIEGRIKTFLNGGDHEILLVEVLGVEVDDQAKPLLYHRGGYTTLA